MAKANPISMPRLFRQRRMYNVGRTTNCYDGSLSQVHRTVEWVAPVGGKLTSNVTSFNPVLVTRSIPPLRHERMTGPDNVCVRD